MVEWKNLFLRECLAELVSAIKDADLGKIEIKYSTQAADGSVSVAGQGSWDVRAVTN